MNWVQFKDPLYYQCPPGAVVACWLLTQEIADSKKFCGIHIGKIRLVMSH